MATYLTLPLPSSLPTHELGFSDARPVEIQVQNVAQHWLTQLELACTTRDADLFGILFAEDGFWRDIMAFTADYRSIRSGNVKQAAQVSCSRTWPSFGLDWMQGRKSGRGKGAMRERTPLISGPHPSPHHATFDWNALYIHVPFQSRLTRLWQPPYTGPTGSRTGLQLCLHRDTSQPRESLPGRHLPQPPLHL